MRLRTSILSIVWLSASLSCAKKDPLYCDGETPCTDPTLPFCDIEGIHAASEGIARTCIPYPWDAGVADAAPLGDGQPACTAGEFLRCEGDTLVSCDQEGTGETVATCLLGCSTSSERCLDLDPSNGLGDYLDASETAPSVTLTDGATIDTDTGTVVDGNSTGLEVPSTLLPAKAGGVDVRVFQVSSLQIDGGVQVTGTAALAIVAFEDIIVSGRLSLSANHSASGPGAGPDTDGCSGSDGAPGGGGGFGTMGGNANAATGGASIGNAALTPLRGGCRGGGPSGSLFGAGGGAAQLVSRTAITISGTVDANGGGGAPYIQQVAMAKGGGGAGGALLLEAPAVVVANGAIVVANGGGGRFASSGGSDGLLGYDPAPGSADAGYGGTATNLATYGTTGGGGGAIGRIRVNTAGTFSPDAQAVISPGASTGIAGTR